MEDLLQQAFVEPAGLRGCYVRMAVTKQTQLVDILDVLLFQTTNTYGMVCGSGTSAIARMLPER